MVPLPPPHFPAPWFPGRSRSPNWAIGRARRSFAFRQRASTGPLIEARVVAAAPRLFQSALVRVLEKFPNLQPRRHSCSRSTVKRSPCQPSSTHLALPPGHLRAPGPCSTPPPQEGRRNGPGSWEGTGGTEQPYLTRSLSSLPTKDPQDLTWSSCVCYQHLAGGWGGNRCPEGGDPASDLALLEAQG